FPDYRPSSPVFINGQLSPLSREYFHGIPINRLPAALKKSIIFTIFRIYFLSSGGYADSYSLRCFHVTGFPRAKTHSLAYESASHSRYSKSSFRR
ncbi:MAG TPA: hypothetical protein PLI62_12115, partial [Spirochaetota bacterium]|nr:hypothetical protein [Spirochaetota bacterium]HQP49556.1 hypothetical protein [Spirochaetota bacterium]